jgi:hypothetical protein
VLGARDKEITALGGAVPRPSGAGQESLKARHPKRRVMGAGDKGRNIPHGDLVTFRDKDPHNEGTALIAACQDPVTTVGVSKIRADGRLIGAGGAQKSTADRRR